MSPILVVCIIVWLDASGLNAAPASAYSMSKRYFSYSSGWGPGGHAVSQGEDASSTERNQPSPSKSSFIIYDDQGRTTNCGQCERMLERLRSEMQNLNLQDLSEEDATRLEARVAEVLEVIKKWNQTKANANRSKRSLLDRLMIERELRRIQLANNSN